MYIRFIRFAPALGLLAAVALAPAPAMARVGIAFGFGFPLLPPPVYYAPPPVYYVPPPVYYQPPPVYTQPAPAASVVPAAPAAQTCRPYRTTGIIDGQAQQAYGTACLQPDGTWRIVQ